MLHAAGARAPWSQSHLCLRRASAQAPGARCVSRHPSRCNTHSTSSATSRDLSPALQDELVALCALSAVLVRRRCVGPFCLVSWRSAPPPAVIALGGLRLH